MEDGETTARQTSLSPDRNDFKGFSSGEGSGNGPTSPGINGKQNYLGVTSSNGVRSSVSGLGRKRKNDSAGESATSTDSDDDVQKDIKVGNVAKEVSPKRRRLRQKDCNLTGGAPVLVSKTNARRDLSNLVQQPKEVAAAGASLTDAMTAAAALESSANVLPIGDSCKGLDSKTIRNRNLELAVDSGFSSGGSQDMSPSVEQAPCIDRHSPDLSSQEPYYLDEDKHHLKVDEKEVEPKLISPTSSTLSDGSVESNTENKGPLVSLQRAYHSDASDGELCKICNISPKGAVFVHTSKACSGCCYACALKSWKRYKKCPFCTMKPKNVMKLFSH